MCRCKENRLVMARLAPTMLPHADLIHPQFGVRLSDFLWNSRARLFGLLPCSFASSVVKLLRFCFSISRLPDYSILEGGAPSPRFHPISPNYTQGHPTGVSGKLGFGLLAWKVTQTSCVVSASKPVLGIYRPVLRPPKAADASAKCQNPAPIADVVSGE